MRGREDENGRMGKKSHTLTLLLSHTLSLVLTCNPKPAIRNR